MDKKNFEYVKPSKQLCLQVQELLGFVLASRSTLRPSNFPFSCVHNICTPSEVKCFLQFSLPFRL
uniref:Putative ovule protein n=1 Tax=Solanum chacoense TaxID=4108 RepID=A0A0V0I1U1_SOLCH